MLVCVVEAGWGELRVGTGCVGVGGVGGVGWVCVGAVPGGYLVREEVGDVGGAFVVAVDLAVVEQLRMNRWW